MPPLPPHSPPLPHRRPHNCLSRPYTLKATSPEPRRRRCHACGRTDSPVAGVAHLSPPLSHRCSFSFQNPGAAVLRGRSTWEPGACTPRRISHSQYSSAGTLPIFATCSTRVAKAPPYPQCRTPSSLPHVYCASAWSQRCVHAVRTAHEAPFEAPGMWRHP